VKGSFGAKQRMQKSGYQAKGGGEERNRKRGGGPMPGEVNGNKWAGDPPKKNGRGKKKENERGLGSRKGH